MLSWFKGAALARGTAREIYGAVVAQARQPAFYASHGVPDTPEGRFELVVLHLFLVLERLDREGEAGSRLGRVVIETFVVDMDDNMREMGVGDLAVPRRVKRAAAGLYERALRYRQALAATAPAGALRALVGEIVVARPGAAAGGDMLADYVRQAAAALAAMPAREVMAGRIGFVPVGTAAGGQ